MATASHDGPIMSATAFDQYVRQTMQIEFDEYIEPFDSLPRKPIEVSENESQSLVAEVEPTLMAGRTSAFSTHTAHPEFTDVMSQILSTLLSYPIQISNPFLYLTKAEGVAATVKRHSGIISDAVSCWKASRITGSYCDSLKNSANTRARSAR